MSETRCANCRHGNKFTPRPDEVVKYGVDVMGCNRRGFEGYTWPAGTCEAFAMIAASKEPKP